MFVVIFNFFEAFASMHRNVTCIFCNQACYVLKSVFYFRPTLDKFQSIFFIRQIMKVVSRGRDLQPRVNETYLDL